MLKPEAWKENKVKQSISEISVFRDVSCVLRINGILDSVHRLLF
jgi:hypothetical protein